MAKAAKGGIPITPAQMMAQWTMAPHTFQVNLWNLEVELGRGIAAIFQKSFELGRFNTANSSPWQERTRNYPHPILLETSTLKNSIQWKRTEEGFSVYTNHAAFGTAKRHAGFCYAAVHNAPSGTYTYGGTGVPSKQRQFMGHSTEVTELMKQTAYKLFVNVPRVI